VSALLFAELLKLRTTRTFVSFVAAALGLSLLIAVLIAAITDGLTEQDVRDILTVDLSSLFVLLLGAIGMTGEWRHRTVTSSLLAAPDRLRFVAAKVLAHAAAGALLSLVVTLSVALVSVVILSARGEPTPDLADVLDVLWRNLLVAALFGAIGVAVGAIVRNQVVTVVGLIVMSFAIEPAISVAAPSVDRWLPFGGAANAVLDSGFAEEGADDDLLSPAAGALVLAAWAAGLAAIAAVLLRRRDLT
jgi:ABC-type transport system involved in multi-copper enzyme maturation permease subunit